LLLVVLQVVISFKRAHPTKAYKWDQYEYTSDVSQRTSKRKK
jgi:hypothetical protein